MPAQRGPEPARAGGTGGRANGPGNAMLHCVLACLGYKWCGWYCGKWMMTKHEEDATTQPEREKRMDLYNNDRGFWCAANSKLSCLDCCDSLLRAGRLSSLDQVDTP